MGSGSDVLDESANLGGGLRYTFAGSGIDQATAGADSGFVSGAVGNETRELVLTFIIPTWRDAENLATLLPSLAGLTSDSEIIVVDVAGDVASEEIARRYGARFAPFSVPTRGEQMNHGASIASGDVLVFQHADTEFGAAHLCAIQTAMRDPAIVGGAFYRKFDARHPRLMWLENVARWLTRNGGTLFGDQTVFVRRDVFLTLGGFANIPLMEDVEFSPRLRASGKIALLDPPVRSSAHHHDRRGAWRTTFQNGLFLLLFKIGVSPQRLHRWYYQNRAVV